MGNQGQYLDSEARLAEAAFAQWKKDLARGKEQEAIIESQGRAINTLAKQLDEKQTEINRLRGLLGYGPEIAFERAK